MQPVPVILDTDIGSDIDDAMALAYLLREPRCELVGITTVTGEVEKRSRLCGVLCDAAERGDIPIHCGLSAPLIDGPGQPDVPQYDAIAATPHRREFPSGAVQWLGETILSRPGEITLLSIGPLTNVAALFAAFPEAPGMLRQLVMMCGVFTGGNGHGPGSREWNAQIDPMATAIAYKARSPRHLSVGLEVTTRCTMDAKAFINAMADRGSLTQRVIDMAGIWMQSADTVCFHDPLAAAAIFEPDLLTTARGTVSVAIHNDLAGLTSFKRASSNEAPSAPHEVAVGVDHDRFFELYMDKVAGGRAEQMT